MDAFPTKAFTPLEKVEEGESPTLVSLTAEEQLLDKRVKDIDRLIQDIVGENTEEISKLVSCLAKEAMQNKTGEASRNMWRVVQEAVDKKTKAMVSLIVEEEMDTKAKEWISAMVSRAFRDKDLWQSGQMERHFEELGMQVEDGMLTVKDYLRNEMLDDLGDELRRFVRDPLRDELCYLGDDLRDDLEHVLEDLCALRDVFSDLKYELRDTRNGEDELMGITDELRDVKDELEGAEHALRDAEGDLKGTKDKLKGVQDELKDAKDELKSVKDEIKDAKQEFKGVKDEVKAVKEELEDAKDDFRHILISKLKETNA